MESIMLEAIGQRPTNKNTYFEDGQWWYAGAKSRREGERQSLESHIKKNKTRMFVDGKYISKEHPLHKPGNYKGFTDAAFSSLENYERSKEGEVYIIHNPAFPGWVKVGMAVDSLDRLKQYQTSSPYRDYKLVKSYKVTDRREAEAKAHKALTIEGRGRRGEWFYMGSSVAVTELDDLFLYWRTT
jgi:hypothetical protein